MTSPTYVANLLDFFRALPGTTGRSGPADRRIAIGLHARDVPLDLARAALVIGAARRLLVASPPTTHVRSLAYFLPVIEELLPKPPDLGYVTHLERRLRSLKPMPTAGPDSRTAQVQKCAVP